MQVINKAIATSSIIIKRLLGGELFAPVTVAAASFTNGVCKAGTPLTSAGAVANDGTAVGLLLEDVYEENPNGSLVKGFATINESVAEASYGQEYSAELKTALKDIQFE